MTCSRSINLLALSGLLAAGVAHAQTNLEDEPALALSAIAVRLSSANLDRGGEIEANRFAVGASTGWHVGERTRLGLDLQYVLDDWKFDAPAAFGGIAPWDRIHYFGVSMPISTMLDNDCQLLVVPTMQYAGESGADTGDSMIYGAVLAGSRTVRPGLTLGLGVAMFRQTDQTRVTPYIAVDWRIDERWRLANPDQTGPAGPAGIEHSYRIDDRQDLGFTAAFRSDRFRLDANGPTHGGIGEVRSIPVYLRYSNALAPGIQFSAYAGAALSSRVTIEQANGGSEMNDDLGNAAIVGLSLSGRF